MKNTIYSIILISVCLSVGCHSIARKLYGIKKPTIVNSKTVENSAHKIFGPEVEITVLKFENWKNHALLSIPDMFVFDKNGKYIPYKDSLRPNCNGPAEKFVAELDPTKVYYTSDIMNVSSFVSQLKSVDCSNYEFQQSYVDFYIFFTFSTWSGNKLYKEKTYFWLDELKRNQNIKYKMIAVSQDIMECWTDEQKDFFVK